MIVREPPYDLVALFSDSEMQKLLEALIERGQAARDCTRPFRWRSIRDPRRDTVWREPDRPLTTFLNMECRFLIVWDHQGSGYEARPRHVLEDLATERLMAADIPRGNVLAVAFDPELEVSFRTAWPKVKRVIAGQRGISPPADTSILTEARRASPRLGISEDFDRALIDYPKELFEALVRLVRLRRAPSLYTRIGSEVSLRALKAETTLSRVAAAISTWFPPISDVS